MNIHPKRDSLFVASINRPAQNQRDFQSFEAVEIWLKDQVPMCVIDEQWSRSDSTWFGLFPIQLYEHVDYGASRGVKYIWKSQNELDAFQKDFTRRLEGDTESLSSKAYQELLQLRSLGTISEYPGLQERVDDLTHWGQRDRSNN